jgi:CheY-like chemotaxis protein
VQEENCSINALATARAFRPDLILMDVMMPEMNGVEAAAKMEADVRLSGTPIVFLTALASPGGQGVRSDAAGHHFLAKSEDFQHLLMAIDSAVAGGPPC